jgi:hypothetical protein
MRVSRFLAAAAAASLATAPALAAPVNPASSLSVSSAVRGATPSASKNELAGGGIFVAVLAAAAVIAGIIIVADDDDDSPDSP